MPRAATSPRLVRHDCEHPSIDIDSNVPTMLRQIIRGVKDSVATVMPDTRRKIFGTNDVPPTSIDTDHTSDLLKRRVVNEVFKCGKEDDMKTIAPDSDSKPRAFQEALKDRKSHRASVLRHIAAEGSASGRPIEQLSVQQIMTWASRKQRRITSPTRFDSNILYTSLRDVVPEDFQYFDSDTDNSGIPIPRGQPLSTEETEDTGVVGFHWASESSSDSYIVSEKFSSGLDDHASTCASGTASASSGSRASHKEVLFLNSFPKKTVSFNSSAYDAVESRTATPGRSASAENSITREPRVFVL